MKPVDGLKLMILRCLDGVDYDTAKKILQEVELSLHEHAVIKTDNKPSKE